MMSGWSLNRGCRSARRRGSAAARVTSARAIATRCCWPPESCDGLVARCAAPRPTRSSASSARRRRSAGGTPRVDQRQLDVLERRGARQQVEALEHEADDAVAHLGELDAAEVRDVAAVEAVAGRSMGVSRQPRMFISVDLPEPEEPMIATNSPLLDAEVDRAQRRELGVAGAVDLGDLLQLDQGHRRRQRIRKPPRAPRAAGLRRRAGATWREADDDRLAFASASPPTISVKLPSERPVCTSRGCRRAVLEHVDRARCAGRRAPRRRPAAALPRHRAAPPPGPRPAACPPRRCPRPAPRRGACRSPRAGSAAPRSAAAAASSRSIGDHGDGGRHAGLELQLGVGDLDDRVVGDDVLHHLRGVADLADAALERLAGIGVDREARGHAGAQLARCRTRRRWCGLPSRAGPARS